MIFYFTHMSITKHFLRIYFKAKLRGMTCYQKSLQGNTDVRSILKVRELNHKMDLIYEIMDDLEINSNSGENNMIIVSHKPKTLIYEQNNLQTLHIREDRRLGITVRENNLHWRTPQNRRKDGSTKRTIRRLQPWVRPWGTDWIPQQLLIGRRIQWILFRIKPKLTMKKLLLNISWYFDYYVGYFLYSDRKKHHYHVHMYMKYKERYCSKEDIEKYLRNL